MMKTIILVCVSVVPCCLAGVAGCSSQSQSERPASQTSNVLRPTPDDPALNVTPTSPTTDESSERKDGAKAKADNPRVAKFAELDTDHDGQLSMAEFGVGRTPRDAAKWFGRRDADRNGFLNLAEFVPQSASSASGKQPEVKRKDQILPRAESLDQ